MGSTGNRTPRCELGGGKKSLSAVYSARFAPQNSTRYEKMELGGEGKKRTFGERTLQHSVPKEAIIGG